MFHSLVRTLRGFIARRKWEQDLSDELQMHIEARVSDLVRSGADPCEAARRARMELGGHETLKDECRRSYGFRLLDELHQDIRYALRILRKSPGFTAIAVLSLALGIGANTVVFSVLNSLLVKPLPVPSPDSVYAIQSNYFRRHGSAANQSYPNYREIRDRATSFEGIAAFRITVAGIEAGNGAHRVWGYLASGNYFDVLGVKPAVGRFYRPDEDVRAGANPYIVLSYGSWQQRFGGDPAIAGKTIRLNGAPFTIVGVAPKGFHGSEVFYWPEFWVPMTMQREVETYSWLEERGNFNIWMLGRVKRGVPREQAEANLAAIAETLRREHVRVNDGLNLLLARPGLVGDLLRNPMQAFMAGVMLLAGLVLLATCANLASLLGARAADRSRELAIRISIGSGRLRILRQLSTESICLAILGGAAGVALAAVLLDLLNRVRLPGDFPAAFDVTPDTRVFLFALASTLVTGVLFGIAPARHGLHADPNHIIRGAASVFVRRRWAIRDVLLTAQVALCCVIVTATLVAIDGMKRAVDAPIGFNRHGLSIGAFDLGQARYNRADAIAFQRRAVELVASIPGVQAAAYSNAVPLGLDQSSTSVYREKETDFRRINAVHPTYYVLSPGYFHAMGTRLLAGRGFKWTDDANAPRVAIVNQTFAKQLFGTTEAVGRRFHHGGVPALTEVAGVVEDGKYTTMAEAPEPVIFFPSGQQFNATTVLVARSTSETATAAEIRRVIGELDPGLPVYQVGSAEHMLAYAMFPSRAATVALTAFGILAVMLSITGIYGLASYSVSRRVREIGIRVAVGAGPLEVLRSVLGRTGVLLFAGSVAGIAAGAAADKLLANIVYQASSRDPVVLFTSVMVMAVVGLLAALAPARRAISIDPVRALRQD